MGSAVLAALLLSACPRTFEAHGLRGDAEVAEAGTSAREAGFADVPVIADADASIAIDALGARDAEIFDAPEVVDGSEADADLPGLDADTLDAETFPDAAPDAGYLQAGETCDADGALCDPSLYCVGGVCCTSACDGECEQCNAAGSCEVAVGAACGATFDCTDRVRGLDTTNPFNQRCETYAGNVRGTCNAAGACDPADVFDCAALPAGSEITRCDGRCVRDDHNCLAGELAANVTRSTMCHLNVEAPRCDTECQNSASASAIQPAMCSGTGACTIMQAIGCGPYRCNETTEMCLQSCASASDCQFTFSCRMDNTCG